MIYRYNQKLVPTARKLRKEMTSEEKRIWHDFFKRLPLTVHRQKNIGNYIVDFFIAPCRTAIEIDGSQHGLPEGREADRLRDNDLKSLGITVLRYTNAEIKENFSNVCADILKHLHLTFDDLR